MKNLILIAIIGLLGLTSCTKTEVPTPKELTYNFKFYYSPNISDKVYNCKETISVNNNVLYINPINNITITCKKGDIIKATLEYLGQANLIPVGCNCSGYPNLYQSINLNNNVSVASNNNSWGISKIEYTVK